MVNPYRFYTYAYLRVDRTPYYIGKGKGNRVYKRKKGEIHPPRDKSRIIFLKQNLTEEEAFRHEIYMISVFGRKDLGTGILRNRTNGGEGSSGAIVSEKTRIKQSEAKKGEKHPNYGKKHSEETKRKQSEAKKGKNNPNYGKIGKDSPNYGKSPSEENRKKHSERMKGKNNPNYGKKHSGKTIKKIREARKGLKWWNDGCGNNKFCKECPGERWVLGRGIPKTHIHGYKITSPSGEVFMTNNLSDFCRVNPQYELNRATMSEVANGKRKHHKGWTVLILAHIT